jgi:zinc protease
VSSHALTSLLALGGLAWSSACGPATPAPHKPAPSVAPTVAPLVSAAPTALEPPPAAPAKPFEPPAAKWLDVSGLEVALVEKKGAPLVAVRVGVAVGRASDGDKPGLARVAALFVREGGAAGLSPKDLNARLEALGASVEIEVGPDATTFSVTVAREHATQAIELLGGVVSRPSLAQAELAKVKKRELSRVTELASADAAWAAESVVLSELFTLPTDHHPYGALDATESELSAIGAADVRSFVTKGYVRSSTFVAVVGDVAEADVRAAAQRGFSGLRAGTAPSAGIAEALAPESTKLVVAHRPKAAKADVWLGLLALERGDARFADAELAAALFASKLEVALGKQALGELGRVSFARVVEGSSALFVRATCEASSAAAVAQAMLSVADAVASKTPTDDDMATALRRVASEDARRYETLAGTAAAVLEGKLLGLDDDARDKRAKALGASSSVVVAKVALELFRTGHAAVAVAGDADVVASPLAALGEVKVVDPKKGFSRIKTVRATSKATP